MGMTRYVGIRWHDGFGLQQKIIAISQLFPRCDLYQFYVYLCDIALLHFPEELRGS